MNRLIQPQAFQTSSQVTPQTFQAVMSVIMAVWAGAWVLSQIVKMAKGEEVKKPPLLE